MLLLGYLAKLHGLKGEFIFFNLKEEIEKIIKTQKLFLAPPHIDLSNTEQPDIYTEVKNAELCNFRIHNKKICVTFKTILSRTDAESYHKWSLWTIYKPLTLLEGESYRSDWVGCDVFVDNVKIGIVKNLESTPMGYDMVVINDLRNVSFGQEIIIPYIKNWFQLNLKERHIYLKPPCGLLDLNSKSNFISKHA